MFKVGDKVVARKSRLKDLFKHELASNYVYIVEKVGIASIHLVGYGWKTFDQDRFTLASSRKSKLPGWF